MKLDLGTKFTATPEGEEASAIIRSCVHCGFCTATCPTYLELGDERDGPRGRIDLIRQFFEGYETSEKTRVHLDRCLTCRNCETTCPSDVEYGRLLDITRGLMERELPRSLHVKFIRYTLARMIPKSSFMSFVLAMGRILKPILPKSIGTKIPARQKSTQWPQTSHDRQMLVLDSCMQSVSAPNINASTARILDRIGISLRTAPKAGCCGALSYHLGLHKDGLHQIRKQIDAWWPFIEDGVEAIVITASGCGTIIKEYGSLMQDDPNYATKAQTIANMTRDISEILLDENYPCENFQPTDRLIALHVPCSLQHGQKLDETISTILEKCSFRLAETAESHICCGSAGSYSILQPRLSQRLLKRKIKALEVGQPDQIVTANIGCQLHISSMSEKPVSHWIELLD